MEHISSIVRRIMDKLALRNIEMMINRASRFPKDQPAVKLKVARYIKMVTEDPKETEEYEKEVVDLIKKHWKPRSES